MTSKRFVQCGLVAIVVLVAASLRAEAELRWWTSVTGDTVWARYNTTGEKYVELRGVDGKEIKIALTGLVTADREYIYNNYTEKTWPQIIFNDIGNLTIAAEASRIAGDIEGWKKNLTAVDELVKRYDEGLRNLANYEGSNLLNVRLAQRSVELLCKDYWKVKNNPVDKTAEKRSANTELSPELSPGGNQFLNGASGEEIDRRAQEQQRMNNQQIGQELQLKRQRDAEASRLNDRALQLQAQIDAAKFDRNANYNGMAAEAESLSRDARRSGQADAAWHYGNAASSLNQIEFNQQQSRSGQGQLGGTGLEMERSNASQDVFLGRTPLR